MQPNPEHQKDDADLGELRSQGLVRNVARRERPEHDPRQQVAHQRRQSDAVGDDAEHEGEAEARDKRDDERIGVRHPVSLIAWDAISG